MDIVVNADVVVKCACPMTVNADIQARFPIVNLPVTVNADIQANHAIDVVVNADIQTRNYSQMGGFEEISFSLAHNNLTPQYRITTPYAHNRGDLIQGQLWNHAFKADVMNYSCDHQSGRYSLTCVDRFDVILDRNLSVGLSGKNYASKIMKSIADTLGMELVWYGRDFISSAFYLTPGTETEFQVIDNIGTYRDVVSKIFGWAKDIPHADYTVTWRNNKILVVQRGYEPYTVTLADNEYFLLDKSVGQTRTLKDGATHYILGDQTRLDYAVDGTFVSEMPEYQDYTTTDGISNTHIYYDVSGSSLYKYQKGLLVREESPRVLKYTKTSIATSGSVVIGTIASESCDIISAGSTTTYTYDDEQYLLKKETVTPILTYGIYGLTEYGTSVDKTEYEYAISQFTGQKYIRREVQTTTKTTTKNPVSLNEFTKAGSEETVRTTTNILISPDMYNQITNSYTVTKYDTTTTREDGVPTSTTQQGLPGGRSSIFYTNQESLYLHGNPICAVNGVPPQQSYPIEDDETLRFIARELNLIDKTDCIKRKIAVYKKQIIDVDCRVILPDGEYFVESVNVAAGPSKYDQTVELVRWVI